MKVAFLSVKEPQTYARLMLASVRAQMPEVEVLHLTDEDTPGVTGCTVVRRKWSHGNPMVFRMEHLRELGGDVLVLDTDVIVQADLSPVFGLPFDMAFTRRKGPIIAPNGQDVAKLFPYNTGVMFSRCPRFWDEALRWCDGKDLKWYADQAAVAVFAKRFHVLELDCANFNYTPLSEADDVSRRYAVHYKGKKRNLLNRRFGLPDVEIRSMEVA